MLVSLNLGHRGIEVSAQGGDDGQVSGVLVLRQDVREARHAVQLREGLDGLHRREVVAHTYLYGVVHGALVAVVVLAKVAVRQEDVHLRDVPSVAGRRLEDGPEVALVRGEVLYLEEPFRLAVAIGECLDVAFVVGGLVGVVGLEVAHLGCPACQDVGLCVGVNCHSYGTLLIRAAVVDGNRHVVQSEAEAGEYGDGEGLCGNILGNLAEGDHA